MKKVEAVAEVKTADVIATFLADMTTAARKTYPFWHKTLINGVIDVAPEGSELYRQLIEYQPLDDYYFAGVVALEGAKIRRYIEPSLAGDFLIDLAAQVDKASGRPDRIVSDLVFFMMSRVEVESGLDVLTMPYDKIVHLLLQRIGLDRNETSLPLMSDFAFRHTLGEPLARGVPAWWKAYAVKLQRQNNLATQHGHIKMAAE